AIGISRGVADGKDLAIWRIRQAREGRRVAGVVPHVRERLASGKLAPWEPDPASVFGLESQHDRGRRPGRRLSEGHRHEYRSDREGERLRRERGGKRCHDSPLEGVEWNASFILEWH